MNNTFLSLLFLLFPIFVFSQTSPTDLPTDEALFYLQKAQNQAAIYRGKEQTNYPRHYQGHPYFLSAAYTITTLYYDGILYPNVKLRLDLYKNELIVQTPNNKFNVIIQPDRFEHTNLYSYDIIYHDRDLSTISLPSGYYMKIHTGKFEIWRKDDCTIEQITKDQVNYSFKHKTRYYLIRDNQSILLKNEKTFLKLFPSIKKELNQFIKENRLSFKEQPEEVFRITIQYIEKLTN